MGRAESKQQRVLLHSTPDGDDPGRPLIGVDVELNKEGTDNICRWMLNFKENGTWKASATRLTTPGLNAGWHMVSVLSSTENNLEHAFNGTKFYLDEWSCPLLE